MVADIRSHSLSLFSGVGAPEPGVEATIRSSCPRVADVFVSIAYFDSSGEQFGDGIESITLAPGATYRMYHVAHVFGLDRARLKLARVISVKVHRE